MKHYISKSGFYYKENPKRIYYIEINDGQPNRLIQIENSAPDSVNLIYNDNGGPRAFNSQFLPCNSTKRRRKILLKKLLENKFRRYNN